MLLMSEPCIVTMQKSTRSVKVAMFNVTNSGSESVTHLV